MTYDFLPEHSQGQGHEPVTFPDAECHVD